MEFRFAAIEWREDDSREGPGLLQGLLLPYETRAQDRPELFRAGSLSWPDQGVVLRLQHDRNQPLTRFVPVVRTDGLHINVRLPDTGAARDASTLVREAVCGVQGQAGNTGVGAQGNTGSSTPRGRPSR